MKPKKKQKEASLSLSLSSVPIHVQARRLKARFSWHMVRSAGRSERKCGICADPAVFDAVTSGGAGVGLEDEDERANGWVISPRSRPAADS